MGPDNILIFAGTILNGTPGPGTGRFSIVAKSPLSGAFGEAKAGGWWATELRRAGFDMVIVHGQATEPVYLWIHDGEAELRDARHMWGMVSREAQQAIRKELGDEGIRVALIGPGGEKLVRYACVVNDLKHVSGRAGMGAVMGAKRLKAIAVRGTKRPPIYDWKRALAIARKVNKAYVASPGDLYDVGTARGIMALNPAGILPTENFHSGYFVEAEKISGETMRDTILIDRGGCYGCPIRCKRIVETTEPYEVLPDYGGPEYESIAGLGSLCGVSDLGAIAKANELCNKYTIDTISTGATIAFAMECFEAGLLSRQQTSNLDLCFGNAEAMVKMTEMIGERRGLGDLLAEGPARAAQVIGGEAVKYALTVKGQPLPLHEPRGKVGLALAYALSPTGADHTEAAHDPDFAQMGDALRQVAPLGILEPVPSMDLGPRKVRLFFYLQSLWNLYNSLGLCISIGVPGGPFCIADLVEYVGAVTGWETSFWELMKVGERANTLARIFNVREGFSRSDDTLPERLFEPLQGGILSGNKLDRQEFEAAITAYYTMAGWDPQTGVPFREKLHELDIGWASEMTVTGAGQMDHPASALPDG